jgi:hypothetical protein
MKTVSIRCIGENIHNYDFEFEVYVDDDVELDDLALEQITEDYFYDEFPNEVDTMGFDINSVKITDVTVEEEDTEEEV